MFGKLFSIFRRSAVPTQPNPPVRTSDLTQFQNSVYEVTEGNEDIIAGYIFTATLDPRTPRKILRQHGAVLPSLPPTDKRTSASDGIWLPKTKSWEELGLNLGEIPPSTIASAIGQIPEDGGVFLPFLIAFRATNETGGRPDEVADRAWAAVQISNPWRRIASKLGWTGPHSLDEYVGYPESLGAPALSAKLAKSLYLAGFRTPLDVREATDAKLLGVKGVGPKRLAEIRAAVS